jgi:hypothetical protein
MAAATYILWGGADAMAVSRCRARSLEAPRWYLPCLRFVTCAAVFHGLAADKNSFSSDNLQAALRCFAGAWDFLIGALAFPALSKCCTLFFDKS